MRRYYFEYRNYEAASGGRGSFWPSNQEVEPQNEKIYIYG